MGVPKGFLVCQIAALLILAGVLWFALPRYQYFQTSNVILRGDTRTGVIDVCARTTVLNEIECKP
jgi:hypothetical protein